MEQNNFISLVKRQKYIIIAIPILAVIITYYSVRHLPDSYTSHARIATGLIDQSQKQLIDNTQSEPQESKINLQFSNLIQMMQLKKVVNQVSFQLMIHDLTSDSAFHPNNKQLKELSTIARKHATKIFTELYDTKSDFKLWIDDQVGLKKAMQRMGYDDASLTKKLLIYRANNSDYIDIEYESDSPLLSAFVVNTFCKEFINYYSENVRQNELKAVAFLDSILQKKKALMDTQVNQLKKYKIDNRVLNLNEQAKSLYAQISDFETRKELADKDILAYSGALKSIEDKFNPKDKKYLESTFVQINQDIIDTKNILKQLNDDYIKSNYDPKLKQKVDSVKNILTSQIHQSTDKYILNPLAAKESLVLQKINIEVNLDIAKFSVKSLTDELQRLNEKFDKLVPHEAVIQAYEESIDFASKEYIEILKKYNQTSIESTLSIQLRQVEAGIPGIAQPSKKVLLTIVGGIVSFVLCLFVLFVLYYLDDSIKLPKELSNKTEIITLGFLPYIKSSLLDLDDLWHGENKESENSRNLLRDIRFELDAELNGLKIIGITSLKPAEGKTLFAFGLAYAYTKINKRVLLIDGNFYNAGITKISNAQLYLEDYLNTEKIHPANQSEELINVLGVKEGDISLFEICKEATILQKFETLKSVYDIIIVETSALTSLNKAKEWFSVVDKVLVVFEANQSISLDMQQQIQYLKSLNNKFIGWVLNKVSDRPIKKIKKKKNF